MYVVDVYFLHCLLVSSFPSLQRSTRYLLLAGKSFQFLPRDYQVCIKMPNGWYISRCLLPTRSSRMIHVFQTALSIVWPVNEGGWITSVASLTQTHNRSWLGGSLTGSWQQVHAIVFRALTVMSSKLELAKVKLNLNVNNPPWYMFVMACHFVSG